MDFVFLQARDRGDSRLQPFATFSQYINPWKVTCKLTQQQLCTCVQVERLKHLQSEYWDQELRGLAGADGSSAPPWRDTWMGTSELWHSPAPPSTHICHFAEPAGQMDMHTTLLESSTKTSSSYKLSVRPRVVRHNKGMKRSQLLSQTRTLGLPVTCKGPDCPTCGVLCQLLSQEQGVTQRR